MVLIKVRDELKRSKNELKRSKATCNNLKRPKITNVKI